LYTRLTFSLLLDIIKCFSLKIGINFSKNFFLFLKIEEAWEKLMGKGVIAYTQSIKLQNTTLIVSLTSSVLREELSYGKDKIIKMLNEEMGARVVSKLMLV